MRALLLLTCLLLVQPAAAQLASGSLHVPQVYPAFAQRLPLVLWVQQAAVADTTGSGLPPVWVGESFRERGIPLAQSWCYEVGKRWWGSNRGLQVFVGIMAEPPLDLAQPFRRR